MTFHLFPNLFCASNKILSSGGVHSLELLLPKCWIEVLGEAIAYLIRGATVEVLCNHTKEVTVTTSSYDKGIFFGGERSAIDIWFERPLDKREES